MVKGCQRKMIHVKDMGSNYYEEAYFVLKPGVGEGVGIGEDMMNEAMRIAEESLSSVMKKKKARRRLPPGAAFFTGLLSGGGIAVLACFLLLMPKV